MEKLPRTAARLFEQSISDYLALGLDPQRKRKRPVVERDMREREVSVAGKMRCPVAYFNGAGGDALHRVRRLIFQTGRERKIKEQLLLAGVDDCAAIGDGLGRGWLACLNRNSRRNNLGNLCGRLDFSRRLFLHQALKENDQRRGLSSVAAKIFASGVAIIHYSSSHALLLRAKSASNGANPPFAEMRS